MADVNANIGVHIDTSAALAELKNLQRQLATFHSSVAKSSAAAAAAQKGLQTNLLNSINATGKFRAQMGLVRTSTESFTHALETNKLSMREYFRYAGGSTKTFGRLFKQEFNTIGKVAEERVKKMQTQYIKMGRDASGAMKAISITPNTLNMKDYSTKLAVAAQKQALLNQLLKQGSTNLLNFGKNTQWAGRQLMVGFTIPLAYFGTAAAKTFMDLEKQAIRFKRVYGDMFTTTDQTNKALADVEQLAKEFTKYGVAVTETMEMAANAAAMGKTGAELTAQVAQATRLAVLGGVEQAQALETTISVTNAFGVAAEDLASKINFLNAVENQTVVSIEDLTEAIPKAGPVVKQLGGSVEDLAFFLTAMKEGGINASEGANALKSGLASLINPSDKAAAFLGKLGVNINAIVETNKGNIRNTVIDFSKALDTLDPLNRARAIEQLFGKFQFSRLSTLFQNVTKEGTQAARVLNLAGASIEELAILSERELGVLEDAVGTNFKESIEKLKVAIAPIGKTFLEAVTPIVQVVGRLLDKFDNLGEGTKKFIVVASTLVGVIGPVLLMTFGLLANGVANIIKLFITMRSGFLRAGTNTNLLAQQTSYLNSEQLEAATVAASLNQAHTRLTQSFAVETTAVRLLRQAYIDATVAATRFAMANPGMMMPGGRFTPKKFARGSTYVPGTGNKDNVPAVLMPGEAVIPTDVAQDPRFQPIIDAMVNGKLQAFDDGTTGAGRFRSLPAGTNLDEAINRIREKTAGTGGGANMVAGVRAGQQAQYNREDSSVLQALSGKTSGTPNQTLQKEIELKYGRNLGVDTEAQQAYKKNREGFQELLSRITYDEKSGKYIYSDKKGIIQSTFTKEQLDRQIKYAFKEAPSQYGTMSTRKTIPETLNRYIGRLGKAGSGAPREVRELRQKYNQKTAGLGLDRENLALTKELRKQGLTTNEINKFMGKKSESHIFKPLDPKTKWQSGLTISDHEGIGQYLNRAGKKSVGKLINDPRILKELGYTDRDISKLKQSYAFAQQEKQPTNAKQLGHLARIADLEVKAHNSGKVNISKIYQAKGILGVSAVRTPQIWKEISRSIIKLGDKPSFVNKKTYAVMQNKEGILNNKGFTQFSSQNTEPRSSRTPTKNPSLDNRVTNLNPAQVASVRKFGKFGPTPKVAGLSDAPKIDARTSPGMAISAIEKQFRSEQKSLRRQIEKVEQRRLVALKQELKTIEDKNKLATQAAPLTKQQLKEQKREVRAQRAQRVGSVAGPVAGIAGIGAMAGFMTGNNSVGMAMMGVSALASIAPMLTNPLGLFVAGLVSITAVIYKFNKDMEKARQEGINLAKAMSMTNTKLIELSKITGTVSSKESADRKRQNLISGTVDQQRKFGQNVLESEFGKSLIADIATQGKAGKTDKEIATNMANQLSTAILQGVVTTEQAKSIASALGEKLGSYEIPLMISGELVSLFGINGENLTKDPLQIALAIKKDSATNLQTAFDQAQNNRKQVSAGTAAQGIAGILLGAGAVTAGTGGLGAPIALAASIALLTKSAFDLNKVQQANAKLDAASIQLGLEAIVQNQQLVDALNQQYDLKLKNAKTEKEIKDIEDQRKIGLDSLNNANQQTINDVIKLSGQISTENFDKAIGTSIDNLYKNASDAIKVFKDIAKDELNDLANTDFKKVIQIGFASGELSPNAVIALLDASKQVPEIQAKINTVVGKEGFAGASTLLELITQTGTNAKTIDLMLNYINTNEVAFDKDMTALDILAKFQQKYGVQLDLTTNGVKQLTVANDALSKISILPDKIDKTVVQKLAGENPTLFADALTNFDKLSEGKPLINKTLLVNYLVGKVDPQIRAAALAEFKGMSEQDAIAAYLAKGFNAAIEKGTNKGATPGSGERDTTLDELLKRLKLVRDASVNARGGIDELRRVMNSSGGDIKIFKGINQQLRAQGINQELIDFISDLDPAIQKKFITIKNGIVKITADGKKLAKALNEATLGEFEDNARSQTQVLRAQSATFTNLKAAGLSAAEALEIVTNEQIALAFASGKTKEEIDRMIATLRELKRNQTRTQDIINPAERIKKEVSMAMEYFDVIEREARNIYQPQIDAANKLIDANEKLIDIQQRLMEENYDRPIALLNAQSTILNHDLSLIDKAAESINKKYDAQEKALQQISDITDDIAAKESSRITIADALTRGDLSAAAKAIQQQRAEEARKAKERNSNLLQVAREKEIGKLTNTNGLTRVQIEEKLYTISEKVYALDQDSLKVSAEILRLQDANYNINKLSILPLQAKLQAELDAIEAQRAKWEAVALGVDGARVRGVEYQAVLRGHEDTLKRMKALWDGITSKELGAASLLTFANPAAETDAEKVARITKENNDSLAESRAQLADLTNIMKDLQKTPISKPPTNTNTAYNQGLSGGLYGPTPVMPTIVPKPASTASASGPRGGGYTIIPPTKTSYNPLSSFSAAATPTVSYRARAMGGIIPKYYVSGGYSRGTDTIPAMLTPGEFVVRRNAVDSFGVNNLNKINDGSYGGSSVYNYSLNVNVKSDSSPDDIAKTVMTQIRRIDNQRIKGQK
jgi:TP901 family phage tail tape measure protein